MSIKALQEYTYFSKYARYNQKERRRETWNEAVDRVMNMHLARYPQCTEEIEWIRPLIKEKRFLGSQRALQFGGKPIEKINARMYNCISSYCDRLRFFQEAFWLLLCGCGTGFSVQRHHIDKLPAFSPRAGKGSLRIYTVPDSIEGWADALGILLATYFKHPEFAEWENNTVEFDFSQIRPAGSYLSSGVGKAPGPDPLMRALIRIRNLLDERLEMGLKKLRPIDAYDICMHASDAVLSGGVRRSATLCLFSPDDHAMATAKTGNWLYENPQRARSNNSALLIRGETSREEFFQFIKYVKEFGEPGFIWADDKEALFNPCVEIGMWAYLEEDGKLYSGWQACNLCEINGKKIKCKEDFALAARGAAMLGTLQAGYTDFYYLGDVTRKIVEKESLLGVSITGMMDNPDIIFDADTQKEMAQLIVKTNEWLAKKLGINPAARCTCVKPAGCQKKETLLTTKDGILSLEEIGDICGEQWQPCSHNVVCGPDVYATTSQFYVNGKSATKKIIMQSGVELECTPNHKFKVFRSGHLQWVCAEDLLLGDHIPYVVGGYVGGKMLPLKKLDDQHFNASKMKFPDVIDESLAWLLGLYSGDGSNHSKGIRIHGDCNKPNMLMKAQSIIKEKFDLDSTIEPDRRKEGRLTLVVNSVDLVRWLRMNGLKKNKSPHIVFFKTIRSCPGNIIESYINGYWSADGGLHPTNKTRSWVTTSEKMSQQLVVVLRALGQDASVRKMPPTKSSKGRRMRYWIQERKGRNGNYIKSPWAAAYKELDDAGLGEYTPDFIVSIEDSINDTFDVEVPSNNTYCANSYVSHNTTSCVLGTASGIHPHHARRYFRHVQGNALEPVLQHFKRYNPFATEKSVWAANETDEVITFCVEVPDGAKIKNDLSAIELLEHVQSTQQNWVTAGKKKSRCTQPWLTHNVSNTINVRPDEWDEVANFIYKNRKWFAGISLIPQSGDLDYPQAPMVCVHTPREILQMYGDGALMASGLIVDGLDCFDHDLWKACDIALGMGEPLIEPKQPGNGTVNIDEHREWEKQMDIYHCRKDWVRRVEQFAGRYCDGDVRRCCYLMKEVNNWKHWLDLRREYKEVPYEELHEDEDNTKPTETIACAGGACEIAL